ncbi:MAG: hypothetical protein ABIP36_09190, partial [Acidimicrobiales bacterium]
MTNDRTYFQSKRKALAGLLALMLGVVSLLFGTGTLAGASVKDPTPTTYTGNPSCADLGFTNEFKIDEQPTAKTYNVGDSKVATVGTLPAGTSVTISNVELVGGRLEFDFASTVAWSTVLVKQSNGGLRYDYVPATTNDQNVQTTVENSGGISHVSFCGGSTPVTTTTEGPTTTTTEGPTTTTT